MSQSAFRQFAGMVVLLAVATGIRAGESGYVRFLPNDGNNVYPVTGLLRQWPTNGPKELWRAMIGEGKSAVIEAGGRAFTATQEGGKQWALALDPATGKTLWKSELFDKENHHQVNGPVSSPVVDGDRVYFIPYKNNDGDIYDLRCPVFCLRASDGSTVWSEGEKFVSTEGSTPLIVGNTLYISSSSRDCILVAVDKMTGRLLWKTSETNDAGHRAVYGAGSSLTYQVVEGIPQIIVSIFRNDNMGVNAETGEVLWHWQLPTAMSSGMVSTPVALGSRVFFSGFQGGNSQGVWVDMKVKDGKIEPTIRFQSNRLQCNAYHTVSIVNGAVYGFGQGTDQEALQCTDAETGELIWQQTGPDWTRRCNMTVADGLIFALTKKDELVLAEANKTGYKELGRVNPGIKLGIPQQPTLFNDRLYLRGNDTVVCYQVGGVAGAQRAETNIVIAQSIASDLGGKGVFRTHLLAFIKKVDDRPLYVDEALVAFEYPKDRWRMVHAYRHPNLKAEADRGWHIEIVNDSKVQGSMDFRHRPTKAEVEKFLRVSDWDVDTGAGFRIIKREVFPDAWKAAFGYEPDHSVSESKPRQDKSEK